uniref:Uncharacterized protein n=1 Tax=Vibrio splendidus TaxID=29497 RepID=A0A0H3ZSX2_VIBSP|nr:hypothetical protein [Vibrio splendidus]
MTQHFDENDTLLKSETVFMKGLGDTKKAPKYDHNTNKIPLMSF